MKQLYGWIRHINDLKGEEWFGRPWILLGTGPSLDNFKASDWKDHNICAIYDAYYACDYVDLLFVSDYWHVKNTYHEKYWKHDNVRYVGTRSINIIHIGNESNVVMWDYDCDQHKYSVRIFNDVPQYPCSNTSSLAVLYLARMGVKEIKTFGIDGGKGYSKFVSETYRKNADNYFSKLLHDFNVENGGVYGHAAAHGVKLIKM